jgi:hypothetical protein
MWMCSEKESSIVGQASRSPRLQPEPTLSPTIFCFQLLSSRLFFSKSAENYFPWHRRIWGASSTPATLFIYNNWWCTEKNQTVCLTLLANLSDFLHVLRRWRQMEFCLIIIVVLSLSITVIGRPIDKARQEKHSSTGCGGRGVCTKHSELFSFPPCITRGEERALPRECHSLTSFCNSSGYLPYIFLWTSQSIS